jgi:hypothetical protein
MAFVSRRDLRDFNQRVTPYEPVADVEETGLSEVFAAAFGQVVDEELSISSFLNMGQFDERKEKVKALVDDGLDINAYTDISGVIDYDRISRDTGKIDTDASLFFKRNELLAKRRNERADVMERGSGFAQFFGMATGYMLDPITIATLPIATAGVSLKSMGVLASAMTVGKREAGLALASELAIQPLVYKHKHDIDSPYSTEEALTNIAIAATGAGALGAFTGGLVGYFNKIGRSAIDEGVVAPNSVEAMAVEQLQRVGEDIQAVKQVLTGSRTVIQREGQPDEVITQTLDEMRGIDEFAMSETIARNSRMADDYAEAMSAFERESAAFTAELAASKARELKQIAKDVDKVSKSPKFGRLISEYGGLNQAAWKSEAGMSKAQSGSLKGGFQKPFWRSGNAGLTPEKLAEKLMEDGHIATRAIGAGYDNRDAVEFVEDLLSAGDRFVDPSVEARLLELDQAEQSLNKVADEDLDPFFVDVNEKNINVDIEIFKTYERKREEFNEQSLSNEFFQEPRPQKAAPATVTAREREILEANGLAEDYDADMRAFDNLETKSLMVDGEMVDAGAIVKGLDEDIEGIESVLECALG